MNFLEQKYDRIARLYDTLDFPFERSRYRHWRPLLWEGLGGRVLDAGIGTGRNIPYYPPAAEVIGIDQSAGMLTHAAARARRAGRSVELHQTDIARLPFPDGHFDAVVATFLFCVIPDPFPGLAEIRRVLKKDGRFVLLEYVLSKRPLRRFWMSLLSPYTRFLYGADFRQNTAAALPQAGFEIREQRFLMADCVQQIVARPT